MKAKNFNRERAERYSQAMRKCPDARMAELAALDIERYIFKENPAIIDLGAGDGFLTLYLASKFPKAKIIAVDSSSSMLSRFTEKDRIEFIRAEGDNLPLETGSADIVLSLATFHHIEKKKETFKEVNRILSNEGVFIIADVLDKTKTQEFFDSVVRQYCITGHDFPFLDKRQVRELANVSGFTLENSELKETLWKFKTREEMALFVKDLVGLEVSDDYLLKYLYENFPIKITADKVSLGWQLGFHTFRKQETAREKPNCLMSLEEKKQFVEIIKDMPWLYSPILNSLKEHAGDKDSIVDIGCGNGYLFSLINSKFPNTQLNGVDIDDSLLSEASKKYPFEFIKGDGHKTKANGDLVISNLTLHHVEKPEIFIRNLYDNARKALIISDQLRPKDGKDLDKRLKKRTELIKDKDRPFYAKNEENSILEAYNKDEVIEILNSVKIPYTIKFFDDDYYERFVAVFQKSKEARI